METKSAPSLVFGTRRRGEVLTLIALLGETYPTEIARLLKAPVYSVQRIVDALDRVGVLSTRVSGGSRRVSLDPRYFAASELRALLLKVAQADEALQEVAQARRSRPRRARKPR